METPTDELAPPKAKAKTKRASHPKRGIRKRVLGEGEGDYCIYEIAPKGSQLPAGALIPLPDVPRFEDTTKAMRWIRNESGDLLAGKQVMVFRAMEILHLHVQTKPQVVIQSKPKVTINAPSEPKNG